MNEVLEKMNKRIGTEDLYEKIYLSDEDNFKAEQGFSFLPEVLEYDKSKKRYFKRGELKLSDAEFNKYIAMRILETNLKINRKVTAISAIIIFWFIIQIVGILRYLIS